ncbi:hypothetical protein B0H12DRAFT_1133760 [Mycena haematopus]|nr:hypothetical protein B0H12DRAFT_1133760 [Mycena haematopus]
MQLSRAVQSFYIVTCFFVDWCTLHICASRAESHSHQSTTRHTYAPHASLDGPVFRTIRFVAESESWKESTNVLRSHLTPSVCWLLRAAPVPAQRSPARRKIRCILIFETRCAPLRNETV